MRSSWAPTISQVIKPTKTTYRRLIDIVLLLLLLLLLVRFNVLLKHYNFDSYQYLFGVHGDVTGDTQQSFNDINF